MALEKKQLGKVKAFLVKSRKFLGEVWAEVNPKSGKVTWPTRPQVISYTGVVIAVVTIVSAYLWLLDLAFSWLRNQLF